MQLPHARWVTAVALARIAILALVLATATLARADAVAAPPDDCAPGLTGRSSHGGPLCVPDRCDASACIGGRDCEHLSFCIEARRGYALGGPFVEDVAHGRCDVDADCALGERCEASDVCIDRTAIRTRRIAWSVGALALVTVAALAVVVRRRAAKPR